MTDAARPPAFPSAPSHPAPPEGWRPISGLAIGAFVLALVLVLVSIFGLWWAPAIPLALGLVAFLVVDPARRRGRGFAIAAMAISLPVGYLSYQSHQQFRHRIGDVAAHVLAALRTDDPAPLERWLDPEAAKDGASGRIRERYAAAEAVAGPYEGPIEAGSFWLGVVPMALRPGGVVEIGVPEGSRGPDLPAGALWVRARFAKEVLHVALVFRGGGSDSLMRSTDLFREGGAAEVVSDVRFFRGG